MISDVCFWSRCSPDVVSAAAPTRPRLLRVLVAGTNSHDGGSDSSSPLREQSSERVVVMNDQDIYCGLVCMNAHVVVCGCEPAHLHFTSINRPPHTPTIIRCCADFVRVCVRACAIVPPCAVAYCTVLYCAVHTLPTTRLSPPFSVCFLCYACMNGLSILFRFSLYLDLPLFLPLLFVHTQYIALPVQYPPIETACCPLRA